MKWVLLALAAAAGAFWFWRRRSREEPWEQAWPAEAATETSLGPAGETYATGVGAATEAEAPAPRESAAAEEADPATREMESRLDDETKYERKLEAEIEERHAAAERLKNDPLTARLEGGETPSGTAT